MPKKPRIHFTEQEKADYREWVTKDSGARAQYSTGMVRDTDDGKHRFDLLFAEGIPYEEQFVSRMAGLLTRGAVKYNARNWEKARTAEELERMRASAFRHFVQWLNGEEDEDHAAAVAVNLIFAETTKWKMQQCTTAPTTTESG